MKNDCIFCKIISKEIPASIIYEDDDVLAFLDINPVSEGHTLLIPKEHSVWMQETDDETVSDIFKKAKKIMSAMKKGLSCDYVQISIVGKDIPHFHIHLMPRRLSDNLHDFSVKKYKDGESGEVIKKITSALQ